VFESIGWEPGPARPSAMALVACLVLVAGGCGSQSPAETGEDVALVTVEMRGCIGCEAAGQDRIDVDTRLAITRNGRADGSATEPRSFAFEDHPLTETQSRAMSLRLERLDLAALASRYPPAGVDDLVIQVSYEGAAYEIGSSVLEAYDDQSHQVDQFLKMASLVEDLLLEGSGDDEQLEELAKGLKPTPPKR
jgi:hypothetical protein